jgi:hypothetical protein
MSQAQTTYQQADSVKICQLLGQANRETSSLWFARQFLQCRMEDIHFHTMPYATGCVINDVSYVSVNQDAWLELINTALNPYTEPVTAANVNLLMSDYSGASMWSTTGAIAGGPDSFFCLTCTLNSGGKAIHHLPGAHLEAPEG